MQQIDSGNQPRGWIMRVLTDAHFWVPLAVLLGGLLLLKSIH